MRRDQNLDLNQSQTDFTTMHRNTLPKYVETSEEPAEQTPEGGEVALMDPGVASARDAGVGSMGVSHPSPMKLRG